MVVGYSLAFGNGGTVIGDLARLFSAASAGKLHTLGEGLESLRRDHSRDRCS